MGIEYIITLVLFYLGGILTEKFVFYKRITKMKKLIDKTLSEVSNAKELCDAMQQIYDMTKEDNDRRV